MTVLKGGKNGDGEGKEGDMAERKEGEAEGEGKNG